MHQRKFLLSTEKISRDISCYAIGFASLDVKGNIEDAVSAGSGSLVTVGSLHGILTAAHVLDKLPEKGKVGIIVNADGPSGFAKQVITMEHTASVVMRDQAFGPKGPDLGFLRLPEETIGWLKAKNSFFNLRKRREDVLANKEPTRSYVDAVMGIIHELTKEVPSEKTGVRYLSFSSIFCSARLSAMRYMEKYELYYFDLTNDPGFALPSSFEGTSGGSVWRFYVAEKDNNVEVVDSRLIGVPFYQTLLAGKRELTCHGPHSIYGTLINRIAERWPNEAAAV